MNPSILPRHGLMLRPARERRHIGKSVIFSVLIHTGLAVLFALLVCWLNPPRLKFSLALARALASSAPASAQATTLEIMPEAPRPLATPTPPPPKTIAPQPTGLPVLPKASPPQPQVQAPALARQVTKPAPTVPRTQLQLPAIAKNHPKPKSKFPAIHAPGPGPMASTAYQQRGLAGFPHPDYPPEALERGEIGTVNMQVSFGPDGAVRSAEVQRTSGYSLIDNYTRSFICTHWKNASYANLTIAIPIIYDPSKIVTAGEL